MKGWIQASMGRHLNAEKWGSCTVVNRMCCWAKLAMLKNPIRFRRGSIIQALAYALKIAESATGGTLRGGKFSGLADVLEACGELTLLVNLSGRGDKDVEYVHNILGDLLYEDPMQTPVTDPRAADVLAHMTAESNAREGVAVVVPAKM